LAVVEGGHATGRAQYGSRQQQEFGGDRDDPAVQLGFGAPLWAIACTFIGSLMGASELAPNYGALAWHGHEMLFAYASGRRLRFLTSTTRR
jgi:hypothetical protein